MTRPGFLAVTAVGCGVGMASALAWGSPFHPALAAATVLLALAAHAAANVLNDWADALSGADAANTQAIAPFTGGAGFIQRGEVSLDETRRLALGLAALAVLGGLWLSWQVGGGLLLIGLAGAFVGWAYSARPLQLMARGAGELAVALAWWLVVLGADYVQRRGFSAMPAVIGVSYALMVANILLINGVPDAPSDARVGKRTLAVRLGPGGVARAYLMIALAAQAWAVGSACLRLAPLPTLAALVALPASLAAAALLWRHAEDRARLRLAIVLTILAALLHGLGLMGGLLFVAAQR